MFALREKSTFLHHKEMSSHFVVVFYGYSHSHLACLQPNQIKFGRDEICFHFKIRLTWCASELKFQQQWSQLSAIVNGKFSFRIHFYRNIAWKSRKVLYDYRLDDFHFIYLLQCASCARSTYASYLLVRTLKMRFEWYQHIL